MSNEKLFINGIEFNDETQYSMNEEILRARVSKLNKQIKRGNKVNNIMWKIMLGMAAIIICMAVTITIQHNKINNLNAEYETLDNTYENMLHEYTELAVDYAQLKDDLNNFAEIIGFVGDADMIDSFTAINVKYSAFPGGFIYNEDIPMSKELQQYAYAKCIENNIAYEVFLGLIRKESTFNPDAVSKSGDYGLCQINKCNHDWMKETFGSDWDPMDPYDSIDASTYMLRTMIDNYSDINSYNKLLMSYNMGHSGAAKHFAKGTYYSAYSRQIMEYANEYGYSGDGTI